MSLYTQIAAAQPANICALFDMNRTLDLGAAVAEGVNVERLLVSQPDDAAQLVEIFDILAKSGAVGRFFVFGSLSRDTLRVIERIAADRGVTVFLDN